MNRKKKPYSIFSKNLKKLRTEKNYTQREIAEAIHVDRSTYSYYECGKFEPSFSILKSITDFLQVDFNTLLNDNRPL